MQWNLTDDRPIYLQLAEQLTQRIASGCYPSGSRIPPVRDLASEAGVNPNTMQRALSQLEQEGLIVTNRTAGRTVTEDTSIISAVRERLAQTHIDQFFYQMTTLGYGTEEAIDLLIKRRNLP